MPKYAVMRCEKISTKGAVKASLEHNLRERETKNADKEKSAENINLVKDEHGLPIDSSDAMNMLQGRLDTLARKPRKDAVLAVEYVFTYSAEWGESVDGATRGKFFNKAREWAEDKYGAENVLSCVVHLDETTPHMHMHVVPMTRDGRLSAKDHIGNRTKLRDDQTSFAEKVAELGLVRGVKGSEATHQSLKRFYGELRSGRQVQAPEPKVAGIEDNNKGLKALQKRVAAAFKPQAKEKGFFTSVMETPDEVVARATKELGLDKPARTLARELSVTKELVQKERKRADFLRDELEKRPELPRNVTLAEVQAHVKQLSKGRYEKKAQERKIERARSKGQSKGKSQGFSR